MRKTLLGTISVMALLAASSPDVYAQRHGGGGAFGAGLLGGVVGGVIGGALVQQRSEPPPVYVAPAPLVLAPPPVVYERRAYVAPPPTQHVAFHPWPGPGFACYEPEPNAINRTICASEDLSAMSLSVVQAVYALIQQTPYSAGAVRAEYSGFQQALRGNCGQFGFPQQADCIAGMLSNEREALAGRLSGAFAAEAARPVALHVELQQRLHMMGLLPGTPDGIYGDSTRRAIAAWQSGQGHPATGVFSDDEVALLVPGYGGGAPIYTIPSGGMTRPPSPATAPVIQAAVPQAPAAITPMQPTPVAAPAAPPTAPADTVAAATDIVGGIHENMPYGLARPKLFAAGWQTQFFNVASLSDSDRDARQWFIDHHMTEVEDCSSSGCKLQFHNADGRLLYVYTQVGSHTSDAYRGAGPSVIAYCLDVDDIACAKPQTTGNSLTQQALK